MTMDFCTVTIDLLTYLLIIFKCLRSSPFHAHLIHFVFSGNGNTHHHLRKFLKFPVQVAHIIIIIFVALFVNFKFHQSIRSLPGGLGGIFATGKFDEFDLDWFLSVGVSVFLVQVL
jgi:hypothetical protein